MNTYKTLILISVLTAMFTACSTKKAQTKQYFRLTNTTFESTGELKPLTLVVKRPRALSILGGRPIVATQADESLVQLSHNYWIESPKVLLHDKIKQWAKNYWQAVSYQTPADTAHQTLETRILAFEKQQDLAVAALEFSMYDDDNQLIFNQQFKVTEPIQADTYKAFTQAMSAAIENILNQLKEQI